MAELKTKPNKKSVDKFLKSVANEQKREDCFEILKIMEKVTGEKPVMWGDSMVGFGSYHYKSERSSQEGDWMLAGFSPRKQNISIYMMAGFDKQKDLLKKLGKHKTSVACLYIKKLSDIDKKVLEKMISKSVKHMRKKNKGVC